MIQSNIFISKRPSPLLHAYILALLMLSTSQIVGQNLVVVLVDGARYSETLGDATHTYMPNLARLATEGAYVDPFYNDNYTYTSRAIPALWTGAWTDVENITYQGKSTQTTLLPTLFEYFRRQKAAPANQCYYVLKSVSALWLPSFHQDYGSDYWPTFHSTGRTDNDVFSETLEIIDTHHPQLLWVYLADVDSRGHDGNWDAYTAAITNADRIIFELWQTLQNDQFYAGKTNLLVTNDHGRHDDQNGGFSGHGDGCDGCRQIMFFAIGPGIKNNFVSHEYRTMPDFGVTAAHLLDLDPDYATGNVVQELLAPLSTDDDPGEQLPGRIVLHQNYPNPFNSSTTLRYDIAERTHGELTIYDMVGNNVVSLISGPLDAGSHQLIWDGADEYGTIVPSGIYMARLVTPELSTSIKVLLLK